MQVTGNNQSYTPYKLSIRLKSDGFSLCIYDNELSILSSKTGKIDFSSLNETELIDSFELQFETTIGYKYTELIIENDLFTTIPKSFFETQDYAALLKFQHPTFDANKYNIFSSQISPLNVNLVFACPTKITNAISSVFSDVQISHSIVEFINTVKNLNENGMFVSVKDRKMTIVVISNSDLQLLNSYEFSAHEDILYHILNVFENLKLQPTKEKLTILPNQAEPDLQLLLTKYLPNTTFLKTKL